MGNVITRPSPPRKSSSLGANPLSTRYWSDSDSYRGAVLYPEGSCYYGGLVEGQRSGFGILLSGDGIQYEGTWANDGLVGDCSMTTPDGTIKVCTVSVGGNIIVTSTIKPESLEIEEPSGAVTPTENRFRHRQPTERNFDSNMSFRTRIISSGGQVTPSHNGAPFTSTSSTLYIPRPPSRPDSWFVPYDQLRFDSLMSNGCTGCSSVYKGHWLGKEVVMRVYSNASLNSRCMQLLSRMARIRHPNICLFMAASYSEESKKLCIVTEYVVNGSLEQYITKPHVVGGETSPMQTTQLSAQNILHLAKGVAVGCAYLRKQGFSHKNLKPSNVLIDGAIDVKLTDYSVKEFNELFHSKSTCTRQFAACNLLYVAPESLRVSTPFLPYGLDTRSDVFSFGVLLQHMITGKRPYEGLSASQVRLLVGYGGYREPVVHSDTLRAVGRLIERCTEQDPSSRINFERLIVALIAMHSSANSAAEDALITFISGR
jgi:hypothetical protein